MKDAGPCMDGWESISTIPVAPRRPSRPINLSPKGVRLRRVHQASIPKAPSMGPKPADIQSIAGPLSTIDGRNLRPIIRPTSKIAGQVRMGFKVGVEGRSFFASGSVASIFMGFNVSRKKFSQVTGVIRLASVRFREHLGTDSNGQWRLAKFNDFLESRSAIHIRVREDRFFITPLPYTLLC